MWQQIKKRPSIAACLIVIFTILFLVRIGGLGVLSPPPSGKVCTINGWVTNIRRFKDDKYKRSKVRVEVRVTAHDLALPEKKRSLLSGGFKKVFIDCDHLDENIIPGKKIAASGTLNDFEIVTNPGQFDSRTYYRNLGFSGILRADKITFLPNSFTDGIISLFQTSLYDIREKIKNNYVSILGESDAGTVSAMVLGDKMGLSEEVRTLYMNNSIAHLLAISGLHISLLGAAVLKTLKKLKMPYNHALGLTIIFLFIYGFFTGFQVSTTRAVIMMVISLWAGMIKKSYDMKSAMFIAAVLILIQNPLLLFQTSFQLSFLSVIGIGYVYPCVKYITGFEKDKSRKKYMRGFKGMFSYIKDHAIGLAMESLMVSISISLVSLPVLLYTFYEISLSGFLLNMIVIPLMSLLVITAFAGGMLSLFFIPSAAFILGSTHYILAFFNILCLIGKSIPFNKIIAGKPSLLQTGIYYFLIVLVIYIVSVNKRTDKLNCMWISFHGDEKRPPFNNYIRLKKKYCFLIVITGILILSYRSHVFKISMLDIGQGDAFVMQNSLGNVYISDCGSTSKKNVGTNILVPFLKSQGISTIDAVFVSHMDEDHVNGVIETLQEPAIRVKNIFISNVYASQVEIIKKGLTGEGVNDNLRCLVTLCNERKIPLYFLKAGDAVKDKKFRFSVLYPMRDTKVDNENDASLIMRLDMSGFSMLFTGDAGEKAESDVISKMNPERVLVLKVGHHGSRFSSSDQFLDAISPKLALISCGKNNRYGHPHEETIEKLGKRGAMIERTDKEGYVEIRKNKGNIALLNHISKNR